MILAGFFSAKKFFFTFKDFLRIEMLACHCKRKNIVSDCYRGIKNGRYLFGSKRSLQDIHR